MNWQWRHSIKQQGRRVAHRLECWRYPQVFAGQLSEEQAGLWIAEAIRERRPVLVGRLGSVEARLLAEAQSPRSSASAESVFVRPSADRSASTEASFVRRIRLRAASIEVVFATSPRTHASREVIFPYVFAR